MLNLLYHEIVPIINELIIVIYACVNHKRADQVC